MPQTTEPQPVTLPPAAHSATVARRFLHRALADLGAQHLEEAAEVGLSELVTNAVLHGRTDVTVAVRRTRSGRVRIEVTDRSPVRPAIRRTGPDSTTGRGLHLVASLSVAWGVKPLAGRLGPGKTVWFEPRGDRSAP